FPTRRSSDLNISPVLFSACTLVIQFSELAGDNLVFFNIICYIIRKQGLVFKKARVEREIFPNSHPSLKPSRIDPRIALFLERSANLKIRQKICVEGIIILLHIY